MSIDTIGNMLSQIKNASMIGKEFVELPHSNMNEAIAKVIEKAGFIKEVKVFKESGAATKSLHIDLAYDESGDPRILDIKRISKPGRRLYSRFEAIKRVNPKYGLVVVSTPKGVMSGEDAKKQKAGGELVCEVK